jgi:hypothetical protein
LFNLPIESDAHIQFSWPLFLAIFHCLFCLSGGLDSCIR